MIFVTVGTHEQAFDRLIKCIDELKGNGKIDEEIVMQTGYSKYEPQYCEWSKLYPYSQMLEHVRNARIVITHGGPSSFIMPLQIGKIPIVVPRQYKFNEHVNDHQLDFCRQIKERMGTILLVENESELLYYIENYDYIVEKMQKDNKSNNKSFCYELDKIVENMFEKKRKK